MRLGNVGDITKKKTGEIILTYNGKEINSSIYVNCADELKQLYSAVSRTREDDREAKVLQWLQGDLIPETANSLGINGSEPQAAPLPDPIKGLENLINFFSEFNFEPNFRFVNTLARNLSKSEKEGREYISNYFSLIDSPYKMEIAAKMKSDEFKNIIFNLSGAPVTKQVNTRFKLYYGSQGTGKTTIAQNETGGNCIVCNSSMLPSDIMEDFAFDDGKAGFHKSAFWTAMENGTQIVMDEINLLPFDSLRFLQGILDGKKSFIYKGQVVNIADGFKVIGTMNLQVNGMTYGLPEPLVDRCEEMRQFKLTAKDLLTAF